MNGWQRLWLVLTATALIMFGGIYPLTEVYKFNVSMHSYRQDIVRDLQAPRCAPYINLPARQLVKPAFNDGSADCTALYYSRTVGDQDVYPYTLDLYDKREATRKRADFLELAGVFSGLIAVVSGLVYLAGFLVAWIRRGFARVA
jgi:hypothetical protein